MIFSYESAYFFVFPPPTALLTLPKMAAETATAPATDAAPAAARPQKPDEDAYKKALDKAEKEHKDVMTRFVCFFLFSRGN